jgi:hypothetical protein
MDESFVSVEKVDYLEEDQPIRNQNFFCVSFISPEDVIKNKEVFYFKKFLENFGVDMKNMLNSLKEKYPEENGLLKTIEDNHNYIFNYNEMDEQYNFFKSKNDEEIEKDYHKDQNFQTTIRGFKVRGCYDTVEEAKKRCDVLKKKDPNFNIFVASVGAWCPFAPNVNDIEDQKWNETQLNTLMMNYKKNKESKDEVFQDRRDANVASTSKTFDAISKNVETDPENEVE